MKTILLTSALTINIVSNNIDQIKSYTASTYENELTESSSKRKIFFKQDFNSSQLEAIYGITKDEFSNISELKDGKAFYEENNNSFYLKIKIKKNSISVKFLTLNSEESEIIKKVERVKNKIKSLL